MIGSRVLLVAGLVSLAACSDNDAGSSATDTAATSTPSSTEPSGDVAADGVDGGTGTSTSPPTTLPPNVVAFDGSVESLVLALPEARNFASGVEAWLDAVPGQEGVLRNSRGITMFVPVDEGFPEDAAAAAFADPDTSALTIGEHLHVGALAELEGTIVMATGAEHSVGDGGATIGGRRVVRSEAGTNGMVYLIEAPLPSPEG